MTCVDGLKSVGETSNSLQYIQHVDGLRAISLLLVLLFHLEVPGFRSGFVGVDAFFTISGFLITRQILHEISISGTFSFSSFYCRRVQRLLPALLATLFLLTIVGVGYLPRGQLLNFGKALASAALSFSNGFFIGRHTAISTLKVACDLFCILGH